MIHYINENKKRLVGRSNQVNTRPLCLEYNTIEELDFQFIDDQNKIVEIGQLSGLALAVGLRQNRPSYDLLALSRDYVIEENVIHFRLNCYTTNWLRDINKNNTEAYIELSQESLTEKRVLLRDTCLVWPRTYVDGLSPEEIESNNYFTKTETQELVNEAVSGLASEEYVDEAISEATSGFVDEEEMNAAIEAATSGKQDAITEDAKLSYDLLSGTPDIPSKTSELYNDSGFVTITTVDAEIEAATSGLATSEALNAHTSDTVIHVTAEDKTEWSGKQDAITAESKLAYDLLSGTPTIPTKTSELDNDSDFVTSTDVTDALSGKQDLITAEAKLDYALLSGTPTIPLSTSELVNDSDYQTSTDVANAISGKQDLITAEAKLDYALLSGTPTIPTSTSQLTNDSDFVTSSQIFAEDYLKIGNVNTISSGKNGLAAGTHNSVTYANANAQNATAVGHFNTIEGSAANDTAVGYQNKMAASFSLAAGSVNTLTGVAQYDTELGVFNTAKGNTNKYNTIIGVAGHINIGLNSLLISNPSGNFTPASHPDGNTLTQANHTAVVGGGNTSTQDRDSFVIGNNNSTSHVSGTYVIGDGNYAGYASNSYLFGHGLDIHWNSTTPTNDQIAIGQWNVNPSSDVLLVVGNGTATNARSNAFTIYKNGDVAIAGSLSGYVTETALTSGYFNKTQIQSALATKLSKSAYIEPYVLPTVEGTVSSWLGSAASTWDDTSIIADSKKIEIIEWTDETFLSFPTLSASVDEMNVRTVEIWVKMPGNETTGITSIYTPATYSIIDTDNFPTALKGEATGGESYTYHIFVMRFIPKAAGTYAELNYSHCWNTNGDF